MDQGPGTGFVRFEILHAQCTQARAKQAKIPVSAISSFPLHFCGLKHTPILKVAVTNRQGFFDLSDFYFVKLILYPPNFEATVQLQIWVKQKMLDRLVTFGPKSVKNALNREIFLN